MTDRLFLFVFFLVFCGIVYYLIFRIPEADILFSSGSRDEIGLAQAFLEESGIKTYIKNPELNRFSYYGTVLKASLHVVNTQDRERALRILENRK